MPLLIITIVIIVFVAGIIFFLLLGLSGDYVEGIEIYKMNKIPENAQIIHLTDADFEEFPMMKNMPTSIRIKVSLSDYIFPSRSAISKDTADALWAKYSGSYLEWNGSYYRLARFIS
ncbi:MAG: hypothetical protein Q4Q53_00920 [Methanocorpusculum sp.]|nr:hypothetical protein [Methanocorpusculum sp.]